MLRAAAAGWEGLGSGRWLRWGGERAEPLSRAGARRAFLSLCGGADKQPRESSAVPGRWVCNSPRAAEARGDGFGADKYNRENARGCAPCAPVAPLSLGRRGGGTGTSPGCCASPAPGGGIWDPRQGVPGAERGSPDTLELPGGAWFAASPAPTTAGFGVRFSSAASAISASLQLFLCLSCFTWPGGFGVW